MESMVTLLHNPRCTTSRRALAILNESAVEFDVVQYLKAPLSLAALSELIGRLDAPPADLVRKDRRFKELGLNHGDYVEAADVADLLVTHPELMQRPVIDNGKTAFVGRSPDRVHAFINS